MRGFLSAEDMDGDNFTAASVLAKLLTASFVDGKVMRMWVYIRVYMLDIGHQKSCIILHLSHLKYPGKLIAIGDYTTWFTGDYDNP